MGREGCLDDSVRRIDRGQPRSQRSVVGQYVRPGAPTCCRGKELGSRGGPTTKIHAVAEGVGRLVHFLLTGGNVNDCTQGPELLETVPAKNVLGDKAYDTNEIIAIVERNGGNAVIPSKSNRRVIRPLDTERYKNRNRGAAGPAAPDRRGPQHPFQRLRRQNSCLILAVSNIRSSACGARTAV